MTRSKKPLTFLSSRFVAVPESEARLGWKAVLSARPARISVDMSCHVVFGLYCGTHLHDLLTLGKCMGWGNAGVFSSIGISLLAVGDWGDAGHVSLLVIYTEFKYTTHYRRQLYSANDTGVSPIYVYSMLAVWCLLLADKGTRQSFRATRRLEDDVDKQQDNNGSKRA